MGRGALLSLRRALRAVVVLAALAAAMPATAATLQPNFQESTVFSGLTNPTSVRFAPDGRVFVAEKSGLIKTFDSLNDGTASVTIDLTTNTYNFWDRGMLGLALDPEWATQRYVYVLYTYDKMPGNPSVPRWGTPGVHSDPCPPTFGATADGCVVTGRLSRFPVATNGVANGPEQVLVEDWCQQYPSHSIGQLAFGSDGALYVSGGDGASFNFTDWGQDGNPVNPCGDPPGNPGTNLTPPTAEGGALRSQDLRTTTGTDPVSLDGTILRIDKATGAGFPGNPLGFSSDANARRIVAHGLRNPFRLTVRPGTNDVWVGDVGWNNWEEVDHLGPVADTTVDNFGWPCYEGNGRQSGYDGANLNICETLYSAGASAHRLPHYTYSHSAVVVNGESCPTGGSSIAGMAFYNGGNYPSSYLGALFFADYSRDCIWAMLPDGTGLPNASNRQTFVAAAANPVDLQTGPNGDLFYSDFDNGRINRIRFLGANNAPVAQITANPTSGPVPLPVSFSGAASSDADGHPLTYTWDLNGDGTFGDATGVTTNFTYTVSGTYTARLRVTDSQGASDTEEVTINANASSPPAATILSPSSSLNWKVGDTVNFSGTATDPEDGTLPGSALSWSLILHHCPSTCHQHPIQDFVNTAGSSFVAPDHEYPSYLELKLTATDSSGVTDTESVLLQPQTVNLTFETAPQGLQVAVGGTQAPTPLTRTVIVGSANTVSAISPQASISRTYAFASWSDGGAQTHTITAPTTAATYTATYTDTGPAPPEGLVAAFGFEEGTGTTVNDASAHAHLGTLEGGTAWSAAGKYGGALFFDGINDNVRIDDTAALDLSNGMTLSAWVKPESLVGWKTVLMKEDATTLAYALYGNTDTNVPSGEANIGGGIRTVSGGGQLPLNAWTHIATTYDGATMRLFVNGAEVGSTARTGGISQSAGPLRIGGNTIWPEWFHGYIDDVRVYQRALQAAEIQSDMNTPTIPPPPGDTEPPTAPTDVTAAGTFGQVQLNWTAATDNVAVVRYNVHRSTVASFLPNQENRVAQVTSTSYLDTPLAPGVYFYKIVAEDGAGLLGPPSNSASGTVPADSEAPTAPTGLTATVQGGNNVALSWTASADNVGVARYNVHRSTTSGFTPGPANRIAQPTAASYTDSGLSPGTYFYVVTAQDAANNVSGLSNERSATIDAPPPPPPTLVAAYSFDEGTGTSVADLSGNGNTGTVNGATWGTGRFGQALSFDGVNDRVVVPDSPSLDLTTGMTMEAWVRPTAPMTNKWRTVLFKHRDNNATNMMYVLYANRNTRVPNAEITNGTTVRAANGTTQVPENAWTHLAATYDGTVLRLYMNATQVGTIATTGAISVSNGQLWIGANNIWPEWFAGLIDEVRIYRRALTQPEISADMNTSVGVPDTEPPTMPGNLQKTGSTATSISVSWTASTDNVGVAGYRVFRGVTEVGTTTNTTFTVGSLSCGSAHDISVEAFDLSNRASPRVTINATTSDCDTTKPAVSVTAPSAGATLSGADVTLSASATDNDAVAGVQFLVDGAPLGAEDITAPYSISWNTFTVTNGPYAITARARDASGNTETSAPVNVTVNNTAPQPAPGLVAAYSFDEGNGTTLSDLSGTGNNGTLVGPTWATGGRFGQALSFDGVDDRVVVPDSSSLDLTTGMTMEAWVRPSAAMGTTWRTVLFKHRDNNATNMVYVLYANRNTSVPNAEITNGTSVRAANGTSQVPAGAWTHLAATYDGAVLRLYMNGNEVSQLATAGSIALSTGQLWIGANNVWGERFAGLIDEIRIYNRPLSASEITTDMNRSVGVPDTEPPTTPGNLQKTGSTATSVSVSWTASTDNVGLAGYRVFRGTTEVGTTTNTNFTVGSLSCGSAHQISVEAYDFSDNESPRATINATTSDCDTTPPTVAVTAPSAGATVSGATVNVAASASDNDSVSGVQFLVDGAPLGAEDTAAPYAVTWNTWSHANGQHNITARARDSSGNTTTSASVSVTVSNTGLPPQPGLVASYGFDEGSGTAAADSTGSGNHGTLVNGPTWTIGRFGQALSFDGTNDRVTVPDASTLDLTTGMTMEAWVKPTVTGTAWKTVLFKHRDNNATNMVYVMYANRNTNVPNGEITVGTSVKAANGPTGSGLPLNVWSHLTVTFDNATLRLYVNGNEIASLATAGPIATSNGSLWIGGNNVWNEFFSGVIDEVRIYNRALNASEIQADMNRGAAPDSDPPAVVATTPADGATGFGVGSAVTATFDEAMNPATITGSTFELRTAGGAIVPASVSYDSLTGRATLTPASPLAFDSSYTATVEGGASGVKDFADNALAADRTWSFLTVPPPPPIAVVSGAANRFGSYAVQMLRAEGLNSVDSIDLASLNAAALAGRDVVVLGEAPLTAAQVTTLTNWVNGGGNLIALRPDKQLAGLLGLTDAASTLANAYMRIDTTPGGPGAGLASVSMQFHGTADRYTLNGATAVATLYNTSTTASANPAVTLRSVGASGGQAAAFTYDLARSIVYTRQGNPAWAGQDRDGVGPTRTNDLFYGAMAGDVQPDWLDTQKIGIPQADEQQRLLANLVLRMTRDRMPLPRFWYLPRDEKAAVIMTGDDHADGGTAGRFDQHIAQSAPGCSVADWECVRATSFVYPNSPLTNAQAGTYNAAGFEVSLHVTTGCQTNSPSQIDADYRDQLTAFGQKYTNVPAPRTNRTHCVAWSDWSTEPRTELAHGIRLDTNYYHFPQGWIGALPGYMTGSGLIMRFADLDGSTINTWQAHTHINDEAGQVYSTHINYLLDNAIGANGYYGMFTMNMHTDQAVHPGSDAIVASAQARGVPVITARQALDWVDGRDTSTLTSFTWSGNQLSFTLRPGTGARGLRAMLPTSTATADLNGITRDGGTVVPFTTQVIKGVEYAVFDAQNARYTATYGS